MNHLGDTNKMVSATPRTDAAYGIYELQKTAYDLEIKLNAANDRIKRLEEAGDAMVNEGWNEPHLANAWRIAKEAKL